MSGVRPNLGQLSGRRTTKAATSLHQEAAHRQRSCCAGGDATLRPALGSTDHAPVQRAPSRGARHGRTRSPYQLADFVLRAGAVCRSDVDAGIVMIDASTARTLADARPPDATDVAALVVRRPDSCPRFGRTPDIVGLISGQAPAAAIERASSAEHLAPFVKLGPSPRRVRSTTSPRTSSQAA